MSENAGRERGEDYPAVGLGETFEKYMDSVKPLPDGWPETWGFQSWGCDHYFHWDNWEGHYRCLRCKYTLEKPPRHLKTGDKSEVRTDGGEDNGERPGCHCADCLETDVVCRFDCPDCPPDLDGHYIAGEGRAKAINASHKHEASSVEVVWRAQ